MSPNHKLINASRAMQTDIRKKNAFHVAGSAAAVYIGNKQKKLPPIFFQIRIKPVPSDFQTARFLGGLCDLCTAHIEGGRLIHFLPLSIDEATKNCSIEQKLGYEHAFEADIINLLVGPLAEAKYVALRDDELMNPRLVNINALHHYDGTDDLLANDHETAASPRQMKDAVREAAERGRSNF